MQPVFTLLRQSSPFAFASTSTSITTESGRVTWQSILTVLFLKIFGVPLFKTLYQLSSLRLKTPTTPLHQAVITFLALSLRLVSAATSCRVYQWNAAHSTAYLTSWANEKWRIIRTPLGLDLASRALNCEESTAPSLGSPVACTWTHLVLVAVMFQRARADLGVSLMACVPSTLRFVWIMYVEAVQK